MTRIPVPVVLADGRTVGLDDSASDPSPLDPSALADDAPVIVWHRGSPHTGALLDPLLTLARDAGVRMLTVARPGYGLSTPLPGRTVADAARDVLEVADLLGIDRFAVMGESGGGPHALATAALAPERVAAVAVFASVAPFVSAPAWWEGMRSDAALRAALAGREARIRFAEHDEFDPGVFVDTDWAALSGAWAALGADAGAAGEAGSEGLVEDDLAFTRPWGVDLAAVHCPVLLVQGRRDRMIPQAHAELIAAALADSRVWWRDDAGHVAVLERARDAIGWVLEA